MASRGSLYNRKNESQSLTVATRNLLPSGTVYGGSTVSDLKPTTISFLSIFFICFQKADHPTLKDLEGVRSEQESELNLRLKLFKTQSAADSDGDDLSNSSVLIWRPQPPHQPLLSWRAWPNPKNSLSRALTLPCFLCLILWKLIFGYETAPSSCQMEFKAS